MGRIAIGNICLKAMELILQEIIPLRRIDPVYPYPWHTIAGRAAGAMERFEPGILHLHDQRVAEYIAQPQYKQ